MGNVVPYYRRSVGVIVFREDGKMLVGQRSAKKPDGIGTWQFPQGGYQGGETALETAHRELKEEMGLDTVSSGLQLVQRLEEPISYDHPTWTHKGQTMDWVLFYWAESDLSKCYLQNEEVPEFDQADFFDWDTTLQNVVHFKLSLYQQLRQQTESLICDFLNKIHTDPSSSSSSSSSIDTTTTPPHHYHV